MSWVIIVIIIIMLWIAKIYFIAMKLFHPFQIESDEGSVDDNYYLIVPIHNEESIIKEKLVNLKNLNLKKTNVCLVDSSSDRTGQIIKCFLAENKDLPMSYIYNEKRARNVKINIAMAKRSNGRVIVSDADSLIKENFEKILDKYFSDKNIALVSAKVQQINALKADKLFWRQQDKLRAVESNLGHCSVASGAFYSFRPEIISSIGDDVWADDIYIPFLANNTGYKSVIAKEIFVQEIRTPSTAKELYAVKVRKAKDNIKESVKNCFRIDIIKTPVWAIIFYTRLLQLLSPLLLILLLANILNNLILLSLLIVLIYAIWKVVVSRENLIKRTSENTYLFTLMVLAHALSLLLLNKRVCNAN